MDVMMRFPCSNGISLPCFRELLQRKGQLEVEFMTIKQIARSILTLCLIAFAIWLGRSWKFYIEALASIFFACSLASVIIIHFRIVPLWRDAVLVVCGTFILSAIDFQVLHYRPMLPAWLSFAGLSSLVTLGVRAIWANRADRKLLGFSFFPALLLVLSEYFATTFLEWTAAAHPRVLDLYLYSFDASLGLQLPFLVGQRFAGWPLLGRVSLLFYIALAIPIAVIYAGRFLRLREKALPSFVGFLATGPLGVLFYNLFPALGAVHLFLRDFPWNPLATRSVSRLYAERVAIPFAVLVEALCSFSLPLKDKLRLAAILVGLLSILGWFADLRYATHLFWVSPLVPWILSVFTVASSVALERKLYGQVEKASKGDPLPSAAVLSALVPAS